MTCVALATRPGQAAFSQAVTTICKSLLSQVGSRLVSSISVRTMASMAPPTEGDQAPQEPAKVDCGVKGQEDLFQYIAKQQSECLNQVDDHPYTHCLNPGGGYLESDCDEQLIISLAFTQPVKIHSLKIKAPQDKGPKTIRIFQNQPNTLDFDKADSMVATQDLELEASQLDGEPINLRYVKYQNVQNLQFFIKDNQCDGETTQIDYLCIVGTPLSATNMNDFKRVSGKKGEVGF